jgi:hypothetical protein
VRGLSYEELDLFGDLLVHLDNIRMYAQSCMVLTYEERAVQAAHLRSMAVITRDRLVRLERLAALLSEPPEELVPTLSDDDQAESSH